MNRFIHTLLDLYIKKYIAKNPKQLKKIEDLNSSPKHFLIISSTALGDTLLSTPAIKSLRKSFPKAEITTLINKKIAPLLKNFKYADNMILYHGGYKKFIRTLREIREKKPEAVLIFHGNGPQDIAFSVLSGANFILKHPTKSPHKKYLSFNFEQKYQHTIEDRLDLVRIIGGTNIEKTMGIPPLDNKAAEAKIEGFLDNAAHIIGFQIGASHVYNMWPIENFIALARNILALDNSTQIVITGIKREYASARQIISACGERIINCCGKFKVDELPYLIKKMRLLITGDTGPMHLAVALKVPTISLFSSADSNITGPYQDLHMHRIIRKDGRFVAKLSKKQRDDSAMKLITPDEVFAQYENFMHNRSV